MRAKKAWMSMGTACMALCALVLAGCGSGGEAETPASPVWVATLGEAQQQAAQDGKRVAVVFYLTDAPAAQVLFADSIPERAVRAHYDRYVWVKLSFDRENEVSRQYRIYVAPTIPIMGPSGAEVVRHGGFMDGPEMAEFLSQHVAP